MKAGRSLSRDFGEVQNLQVSLKGPGDYVSQADRKAEEIIHAELSRARPGYAFLMEERGAVAGEDDQHRWIVDPLDGTTNFLHGLPIFSISIALERQGQLVAGVIYNPAMDELYTAERGGGAFMNDRRLRVAGRTKLSDAVIGTGVPHLGRGHHGNYLVETAQRHGRGVGHPPPRLGGARPRLCGGRPAWTDSGKSRCRPGISAAGILMVREAGGFVSDKAGGQDMFDNGQIVAGNEAIHRALLQDAEKADHGALIAAGHRATLRASQSRNRYPALQSFGVTARSDPRACRNAMPMIDRSADRSISLPFWGRFHYSRAELIADGVVHAVGIVLAIAAGSALLSLAVFHAGPGEYVAAIFYVISLLTVLSVSLAYNLWPMTPAKWILRRFDHAAIYLLIAATYTPFLAQIDDAAADAAR